MFSCPLCTKTFSSPSRLDRHMGSHTKEKPHKCPMCPEAFGQKGGVKQHIQVVHYGIKKPRNANHQCSMCSYKCYSTSSLQVHVRKHFTELPFSCQRPGCGFRTKYKRCLSNHTHQVHGDKRPFKCPIDGCSYKAKTRTHIMNHLRVHSNDKSFACTVPGCNDTFKSKGNLQRHTSTVHSNEKPFKCSVCDFRTKYRNDLSRHELTHAKTKRFQCEATNCSFASHQRYSLKVHFDRWHRTKQVLCTEPRCNYRCGTDALLKAHLQRHKLPILKCPDDSCGFSTKYNYCLLKHISNLHNDFQSFPTEGTRISEIKTSGSKSTLHCSFNDCSFQTKFGQHYDRHVIAHKKDEEGQHVCSLCFSRFSQSWLLKVHVQRHIGETPYSCSFCYTTTMSSYQLKRHARKTHQIHVIPRDKDDRVRNCRTCGKNSFSYGESVLHSMCHLQPVVVLKRLHVQMFSPRQCFVTE